MSFRFHRSVVLRGDVSSRGLRTASIRRVVCGGFLCGTLAVSSFSSVAHADLYHSVAPGETLSGIAAIYRTTPDALRAANGLKEANGVPLGTMLLRVPVSDGTKAASAAPVVAAVTAPGALTLSTSRPVSSVGGGSFSGTAVETVRAGDSWETIAARYRIAGHNVSVESLRERNSHQLPAPGATIVVPLAQVTVPAPALQTQVRTASKAAPTRAAITPSTSSGSRTLGGAPSNASNNLPVARTVESKPPVFRAVSTETTAPAPKPAPKPVSKPAPKPAAKTPEASRGALASRSGFGEMARRATGGGVRVLDGQTTAGAVPAPRAATQTRLPAPEIGSGIARVAKVSNSGATIRRLPEAAAVTLFKPGVGTQLAVLEQKGWWSAVLMSDGSTGWIPGKYLSLSDQYVDVSGHIKESEGVGGAARYSVGRYSTSSRTVAEALRWLGTRYVYGGTSRRGIDCSALVQNSFRACGINLPRTAATQAKVGQAVATENLKPGDRLYFSASGTRIDHTGLYMGDGLFVHASGSGRSVIVSSLFEKRNWNIYVGARR